MNKKPTVKTIAELAGVSHVTVSRALRGNPEISKATTNRILQIAKEIGYTRNAFARGLSSKQSYTLGMIVPALGNDTAYNDVFNAISASAAAQGLSVLLGSCGRDLELEKQFCRSMCENRVGALIISPLSSEVSHIKEICKDMVPVIFLGGKTGMEQENCVTIDYYHSAKLAVEHLHQLGHQDIVLALYEPKNKTISQKLDGYTNTMESLGLTPRVYWEGESSDTLHAGRTLVNRLISEDSLPTAIWCASDLMAVGVIDALKAHNLRIPEDISVMGHDNLFFSELSFISLTTLSLPKKELGLKSVEIALALMNYDAEYDKEKPDTKAVFHAQLIQRDSTGKKK